MEKACLNSSLCRQSGLFRLTLFSRWLPAWNSCWKKTIMNLVWVIKSMKKRRNRWTIFYKKTAAEVICCIGVLHLNGSLREHSIPPREVRALGYLGCRRRDLSRMMKAEKMAAFPHVKDRLVKKTTDLFFSFKRQNRTCVKVVPGKWILAAEKEIPRDKNNSTTSTVFLKILGSLFLLNVEQGWY